MKKTKKKSSEAVSAGNNIYIWMMNRTVYYDTSVHAAQVSFFILVSFFPFMMLLLTVARYTPIDAQIIKQALERVVPGVLSELVGGWLDEIVGASGGVVFSLTIIGLVWSGSKGFDGIVLGLDKIYVCAKRRNYFVRRVFSLVYLLAFIVMVILTLVVIVFGNKILDEVTYLVPFIGEHRGIIGLLRVAVFFILFTSYFLILFKFVPSSTTVRGVKRTFRGELEGAGVTAILWAGFSFLYSFYVNYYGSIRSLYGSLTSLVLLMLWLYFCINFIFIGALINNFRYQTGRSPLSSAIRDIYPAYKYLVKDEMRAMENRKKQRNKKKITEVKEEEKNGFI